MASTLYPAFLPTPAFTFFWPPSLLPPFLASHLFLPFSSSLSPHSPLPFHLPRFWSILWGFFAPHIIVSSCPLSFCSSSSLPPFLSPLPFSSLCFLLTRFFFSLTLFFWCVLLFCSLYFFSPSSFLCYLISFLASFSFLASTFFPSLPCSL